MVLNSTGKLAEGYTEEQLVYKSDNIEEGASSSTWTGYESLITKAKIEEEIKPIDTSYYFYNLESLSKIENLNNLNTGEVEYMVSMFDGCGSLMSVDVSTFDVSNVSEITGMFNNCRSLMSLDLSAWGMGYISRGSLDLLFNNCSSLTSIYATGKLFPKIAGSEGEDMFNGCTQLVGAIAYDPTKTNAEYANSITGYFTPKRTKGICGSVYEISSEEYHLVFNATGELAIGYTEEQLVYTSGNITNGGWFEIWSGCESLITKAKIEEEIKPIDTSYYFYNLESLSEIENLNNMNTSSVKNMDYMFRRCSGLTSLNLSNFNTSSVREMGSMFKGCSELSRIYVTESWTVNDDVRSRNMFAGCTKLVGAIAYDSTLTNDATYANYTTGYLTLKVELPEEETLLVASGGADWKGGSAEFSFEVPSGVNISKIKLTAQDSFDGGRAGIYYNGSTIIETMYENSKYAYVSVTPGKTYTLTVKNDGDYMVCYGFVYYSKSINEQTPVFDLDELEKVAYDFSGVYYEDLSPFGYKIHNVPEGATPYILVTYYNPLDTSSYTNNEAHVEYESDGTWYCGNSGIGGYAWIRMIDSNGEFLDYEKIGYAYSGAGCFVAGTKVYTPDGLINIEDIEIGDIVYSMNMETMNKEESKVIDTSKRSYKEEICFVYIGDEYIECTSNHRYFEKQKGWTEAKDLEIGDIVINANGEERTIKNVEIKQYEEPIFVYNMTVEKNHNYFVGNEMILVHNVYSDQ